MVHTSVNTSISQLSVPWLGTLACIWCNNYVGPQSSPAGCFSPHTIGKRCCFKKIQVEFIGFFHMFAAMPANTLNPTPMDPFQLCIKMKDSSEVQIKKSVVLHTTDWSYKFTYPCTFSFCTLPHTHPLMKQGLNLPLKVTETQKTLTKGQHSAWGHIDAGVSHCYSA